MTTKDIKPTELYERAVAYLLQNPKTEKQLRQWYARKTNDLALVDEQILRLQETNLQDDYAYAVAYVASKSDKIGVNLIKNKLRMAGVAPELIERALGELEDQTETARQLVAKYLRNKEKTPATNAKAIRWLLSKGFDYDLCREVVNENWY